MDLREFVSEISGFAKWPHPAKIKLFGWYLHTHEERAFFSEIQIRECYDKLSYTAPELNRDLRRLLHRVPPELLCDSRGYRLHGTVRQALDDQYGDAQSTLAVAKLLADLPSKVPGIEERVFLEEVLKCYKARAFRATTVMAWNLAYDHFLHWLLADPTGRLAAFNARIPVKYPAKKPMPLIAKLEDFEQLREREVIEVSNSAGIISSGIFKILREKLDRRNTAGHPSRVDVGQYTAEDTIQDLVINVVLRLA